MFIPTICLTLFVIHILSQVNTVDYIFPLLSNNNNNNCQTAPSINTFEIHLKTFFFDSA